jgi:hypothetical protein
MRTDGHTSIPKSPGKLLGQLVGRHADVSTSPGPSKKICTVDGNGVPRAEF